VAGEHELARPEDAASGVLIMPGRSLSPVLSKYWIALATLWFSFFFFLVPFGPHDLISGKRGILNSDR
jgi:hypothetical protein